MGKNLLIVAALATALTGTSVAPAYAITTAQRVQVLKYNLCLQQAYLLPWITCSNPFPSPLPKCDPAKPEIVPPKCVVVVSTQP